MGDADRLRQEVTDKITADEAARKAAESARALEIAVEVRDSAEAEFRKVVQLSAEREAAARKALDEAQAAVDAAQKTADEDKKGAPAEAAPGAAGGKDSKPPAHP